MAQQQQQQQHKQHKAQLLQQQRSGGAGSRSLRASGWGARSPGSQVSATALAATGTRGSERDQQMARVWRTIDTNGDGLLDWQETRELMRKLGHAPESLDMNAVMAQLSPEMDGEVRFHDFKSWWDGQGPEAQQQLQMLDSLRL